MEYDTDIMVVMAARDIPDNTVVTRKTGSTPYSIKHGLTVYSDTKGEKPLQIDGIFLLGERGSISQIKPDTQLGVTMTAEYLYEWLQTNVENIEGDPDYGK